LVGLKVDAIVVGSSFAAFAAKTLPDDPHRILLTVDPVAAGLVDSLARPGGNITVSLHGVGVGWQALGDTQETVPNSPALRCCGIYGGNPQEWKEKPTGGT